MIRLEKPEKFPATRELAVTISTTQGLPGERDVDPVRYRKHERRLEQGKFHSPSWALARDKEGNLWRIDGQHTSLLLARCPAEIFPAGLEVVLTTYTIDSIDEDGAELFEMFNNPDSVRTNKEKMGWYRSRHKDNHDVLALDNAYLVKAANGYDYYLRVLSTGSGRKPKLWSAREHGAYLDDPKFRSFSVWLNTWETWETVDEKGKKKMAPNRWMIATRGIVAAVYKGWKDEPKIGTAFWGEVFLDGGVAGDLSRQLGRMLNKWHDNKKEKTEQSDYYKQAMKSWEQHLKRTTMPPLSEVWEKHPSGWRKK